MKVTLFVIGLLACGLLLISCSKSTMPASMESLTGKWQAAGQESDPKAETYEFTASGTVLMTHMDTRQEGTYELSGSTLRLKFKDLPGGEIKWQISLSSPDDLTIQKSRSSKDSFNFRKMP